MENEKQILEEILNELKNEIEESRVLSTKKQLTIDDLEGSILTIRKNIGEKLLMTSIENQKEITEKKTVQSAIKS